MIPFGILPGFPLIFHREFLLKALVNSSESPQKNPLECLRELFWNSTENSSGISLKILPEFHQEMLWNSTGNSSGVPPDFFFKFHQEFLLISFGNYSGSWTRYSPPSFWLVRYLSPETWLKLSETMHLPSLRCSVSSKMLESSIKFNPPDLSFLEPGSEPTNRLTLSARRHAIPGTSTRDGTPNSLPAAKETNHETCTKIQNEKGLEGGILQKFPLGFFQEFPLRFLKRFFQVISGVPGFFWKFRV